MQKQQFVGCRKFKIIIVSVLMQIVFNQAAFTQLQITLSASDYNGYHISCFGMQDGSISATATGGQAPYIITWSTGDTATSISALAAGYYRAYVLDANNQVESAEITLNEPELLRIEPNVFQYPNGYEISLYGACNGSITVASTGGVSPYSYLWNDNNTSTNRSALCAGNMYLVVTDANGCNVSSDQITLRQPERSDWTMTGNAGSNPSVNFIGTIDSVDFGIRTNNSWRLQIASNGKVKVNSLTGNSYQLVYADSVGNLLRNVSDEMSVAGTAWVTAGNSVGQNAFIGTTNSVGIKFKTNNTEHMRLTADGSLGVGTNNPIAKVHIEATTNGGNTQTGLLIATTHLNQNNGNALVVKCDNVTTNAIVVKETISNALNFLVKTDGKVYARDIVVKTGAFPDYVFKENYPLLSIDKLEEYINQFNHLPGIPEAKVVEANGLALGEISVTLTEKIEELTLYIIELNKRLKKVEAENHDLRILLNTKK